MTDKLALIIEDDFDASQIFCKALEALELKTEVIAEGDKALARLKECEPLIVILDLHLPEVDGTQILADIRADHRLKQTKVIIVSADARMAELIKDDADLVLLKPTSYSQVRDFASRLVMRSALAQPAPVAESPTGQDTTPPAPPAESPSAQAAAPAAPAPESPTAQQAAPPAETPETPDLVPSTPAPTPPLTPPSKPLDTKLD